MRGCVGYDRIVVRFAPSCVILAYNHKRYEFESRSLWGVLDTILCDQVCRWLEFLHQQDWPTRYNWNIVEGGIKNHNPNPIHQEVKSNMFYDMVLIPYSIYLFCSIQYVLICYWNVHHTLRTITLSTLTLVSLYFTVPTKCCYYY